MKKSYGHFFIYALADPTTDRIFYVGRAADPQFRLKQHLYEARHSDTNVLSEVNRRKCRWINRILLGGNDVKLIILDEWECASLSQANRLEDAWMAIMRQQKQPLANYSTSRRQRPEWYLKVKLPEGLARTPQNFIRSLKSGAWQPSFRRRKL